jgi:hypothetical protein
LTAADKQDASLRLEESPWAHDAATGQAALYVMLHRDVTAETGASLLAGYGEVKSSASAANLYVVWITPDRLGALLNEDEVSWVQPAEPRWEVENSVVRARIDSDDLGGAGYGSADGTDVDILIYDAGWVRSTHQELTGRVTQRGSCTVEDHATHVACTTSASGESAAAIGMANNMHALLSDCLAGTTGAFLYTDPGDVQENLVYAKDTWSPAGGDADGAELWNASIGTNTASNNFPCVWEGNYGPTDAIVDRIVRGELASSKFIGVWANGNERTGGGGRCGTTYHTTAPPACGKNAIHIGASNKDADTMTSFSSWGPCDDGRLKPTVTAPGCATTTGIYSCGAQNDRNYLGTYCGTSMATPATSGVVAQLIEYCRAQGLSYCPADGEPWPSSARALLMHAALDLGNAGPDYQWGYGRIDADASADLLTNLPKMGNYPDLRQDAMSDPAEVDTYEIVVSGSPAQLKVSLAWDDSAATMQALTKLVNDLDLEVVSPGGTTYLPYILDPGDPANPATTGVDSLNNQEQVVVSSPANGSWTIRVVGRILPAGPQDYSIIFPNAYNTAPSETPGVPPGPTPTPNPTYCAEVVTNGTFENTSGWTTSGSAARSTTYAHGGSYSMSAGGTSDGTFYQDLALPAEGYCGTISFWYRMQTSEISHPWDYLDVEVRDPVSGQALTTLLSTDDSKSNGVWTQASLATGLEYAGRTIRLHFSVDVDASVNTYWYLDDVSFYHCTRDPTSVLLSGFEAWPVGRIVQVHWETASELDTAGFNLLRSEAEDGEYVQLNPDLIPAVGGPTLPASYRFEDAGVTGGVTYYYKLEVVDTSGREALYGPVSATAGGGRIHLPLVTR